MLLQILERRTITDSYYFKRNVILKVFIKGALNPNFRPFSFKLKKI